MGFSKMMKLLQTKEKGKIVFCNIGNFYVAIGKDAVLLNELIDIKVSCFKEEVCKVGFPIISLCLWHICVTPFSQQRNFRDL